MDFEKCARDGESFLRELSEKLGYQYESHKTIQILKSVFHTIRDHLEFEESLEFLAQIPTFLKPIYVDGWTYKEKKKLKHLNDFLDEVWENEGSPTTDFGDRQKALGVIKIVFIMLRKYVSVEEMNEILAILPSEINTCLNMIFCNNCGILELNDSSHSEKKTLE